MRRVLLPLLCSLLAGPVLAGESKADVEEPAAQVESMHSVVERFCVAFSQCVAPQPITPGPEARVVFDADALDRPRALAADRPLGLPIQVPASWGWPPEEGAVVFVDGAQLLAPAQVPSLDLPGLPSRRGGS